MPAKLLLLGHRGARLYAPENTIPAFDLCLKHGADGFEFDVRCTRSKESIFRQAVDAQKNNASLLEKKFQEAVKKAKETPDEGRPLRDFDLD